MWAEGVLRLRVRREDRADRLDVAEHRSDEHVEPRPMAEKELCDLALAHVPGGAQRGLPVAAAPVPRSVDEGRFGSESAAHAFEVAVGIRNEIAHGLEVESGGWIAHRRSVFGLNRDVASGWVGILTCELHFPEAHSLKEKRMYLRSAKAQLARRVGAAVAEVDHHDVWQRARITAACVAREHREIERLLDEAERWLRGQEWEVALVDRLLIDPDD